MRTIEKTQAAIDTREQQHPVTDGVYVKRLKWNIPKGIYQVISDNPTYESFEINHKNGRNFNVEYTDAKPLYFIFMSIT